MQLNRNIRCDTETIVGQNNSRQGNTTSIQTNKTRQYQTNYTINTNIGQTKLGPISYVLTKQRGDQYDKKASNAASAQ
jgi:hypothetical protein